MVSPSICRVHALRADTGDPVDGFEFRADNWIWSEVLVTGDGLYTASLDGKLYKLDPRTGAVLPPYPFDAGTTGGAESAIRTTPVQAGENVVVGTMNAEMPCLPATSLTTMENASGERPVGART